MQPPSAYRFKRGREKNNIKHSIQNFDSLQASYIATTLQKSRRNIDRMSVPQFPIAQAVTVSLKDLENGENEFSIPQITLSTMK